MSHIASMAVDGGWQKKKKKYDVTKDPLALAAVQWGPNRPKPEFISGIWENEEIEDLTRYIDWHRNHPHCITPRAMKEDEDFRSADKKLDEGNPQLVYSRMPGGPAPIPEEFYPPQLGKNGDVDEVSVIAMEREYEQVLMNRFDHEDPWYTMSVKDQLEQHHVDGDHTTVKSKRSTNTGVVSEFNKEAAWQAQQYGGYAGGYPTVQADGLDRLAQLALRDKANLHDERQKVKIGPWAEIRSHTQFTKDGTALLDYQKIALERNVQDALETYERELREERAAARLASSRKARSRSKKRAKGKVVPEEALDQYETMKGKLGSNAELEKMTRGFVRLAKKVSKHSKQQKNVLETQMDLVEACNKLRVLTVSAMLLLETTNADMRTAEEEPVFLHTFARAIRFDQISGNIRSGTEHLDSGDRKKTMSILQALSGKCNLDIIGREGITAAHMAAMGDNSKLLNFLAEKKANLELFSAHDEGGMTPLMMAAKFGNVYACADLVRHRVDVNKKNKYGMTALHHAGLFGQTRTAKFLLRIGADKFATDNDGRTAGKLAMDSDYMAAGQAISAYAKRDRDVSLQLEYLVEQDNKLRKGGVLPSLSRAKSFFDSLSLANLSSGLSDAYKYLKKHLKRWFTLWKKEFCDYFEIDFDLKNEDDLEVEEEEDPEIDPEAPDYSEGESGKTPVDGTARTEEGGFSNVDGFASVPEQRDNVIGFDDNF